MDYYNLKIDQIKKTKNIKNLSNDELLSDLIAIIWIESELKSDYCDEYVQKSFSLEKIVNLNITYKKEILNRMN
ncbi:MAG: hypothetical protein LBM96_12735 [Methanobrevibacter sp.]|jgi:hypothetical protein|nr:hypothetical protein [Candidatus Methanoflexus mossambicus]